MNDIRRLSTGWIFFIVLILCCFSCVSAGDLIVSWDPNTENDLLGYKVYYGTSSRNYTTVEDVGNVTSHTVSGLPEGVEYFFAVTAYDTAYNESDYSVEVSAFIEIPDTIPPIITDVQILDSTHIDVTFSEAIEKASAENIQNYEIDQGVNVFVAILDMNQKIVHLSTTTHQPNILYTLTLSNISDLAQPPNIIAPNTKYNYIFQPDDHTPPEIAEVEAIDSTHVRITFSEAVDRESTELENNYSIDKGISIIEALLDSTKMAVHLATTAHQTGETYTLTVNHIKDLAPTPNEIAPDSEIQYNYTYQDRESPQVADVQVIYATYLKVLFNETVERVSAENVGNYSINNGIQVFGSILDNDLKTVHLTTSEHQPDAIYKITIDSVRDRSSNRNIIAENTTIDYFFEVSPGTLVLGLNQAQYKLAYLNVGDEYYIDRNYTISRIPLEMNGYLWIKTANDDRDKKDENFLNFQLIEKAKIYIAYDSRALNYPNWLVNDFYRINKSIGVSEYAGNLDLWEKECDPGVISLGANLAEGAQGVESMYVVIIETNNSQRPGMPDDLGDPFSLGPANMFLLYQNYPNPFNAGTEIRFQLPKSAYVELTIYDILGQTVRNLASGYKLPGHHILSWNGINDEGLAVPSGVYFSRLIIKKVEEKDGQNANRTIHNYVRKMIMMK